jgi:hypothetical protein
MYMKRITQRVFVFLLFTFIPTVLTFADPPNPPGPGGPGTAGGTPVGAPIDDGITILLALGIGYAVYKLYELRKKASADA